MAKKRVKVRKQTPVAVPINKEWVSDFDVVVSASAAPTPTSKPVAAGKVPTKGKQPVEDEAATEPKSTSDNASRLNVALSRRVNEKFGEFSSYQLDEAQGLEIGLQLPGLSLEYLLQSNIFPFERITQLLGTEGSFKSAFSVEIARWFINSQGFVHLNENETKFSAKWAASIVGWHNMRKFTVNKCTSVNTWQARLNQFIVDYAAAAELITKRKQRIPGGKATGPALLVVDSIMGTSMQDSQDRVDAAGFADRNFPAEALSITGFMRSFPQKLANWPLHLVMVNHLRPKEDSRTHTTVRDRAGGRGKEFMETFELELKKVRDVPLTKTYGTDLKIQCYKNALGQSGRWIRVRIHWWDEDDPYDPDNRRQVTQWDWDEAVIDLLAGGAAGLPSHDKSRVKDIIDLSVQESGGGGRKVSSKKLGIKKEKPVDFATAGKMIHADAGLMRDLRRALGIKLRPVFVPGEPYKNQLLRSKKRAAELYERMQNNGVPPGS